MKRIIIALVAAGLVGGCGILGGDKKPKTPTVGTRIPVLSAETGIEVDPALAQAAVMLPPATPNAEWTQSGGSASKSMGHLALGNALARAWA
ncbi:MAG TPA: pyrrolo-quinoline quinone, partial [Allosphingosinicella sp.]